jgi:ribose transport system substrate-binding protein
VKRLLILAASLAALAPGAADAAPPRHGDTWVIGVSQCNLGEPWRVQMNADIAKAAESHHEIKVIFKDAQNDTLRQRDQIEEFIDSEVDLLIVSPKEAAPLTQPVSAAYHSGIPVIVLDRKVLGSDYTQFIGADNRLIGRAAGEWAAAKLATMPRVEARGRALIVELTGLMTSTPAQDRLAGFHEAIKDKPIDIIFSADTQWLEPRARSEMESALAVKPDIDLVYAHNDPSAHGAYLAARAAGRDKDILFVGIDGLPQEGQVYVRQGILSACFEYPTGGAEAIENAVKILNGATLQRVVTLNSRYFTPENVDKGGEWLK